jgi:hypothetical protein
MVSALRVAAALQDSEIDRRLTANCRPATVTRGGPMLTALDGRNAGYNYDEVETVLCAMEANKGLGRRMYLERHFPVDMIFPLLYGPTIAATFLFVIEQFGWHSKKLKMAALVPLAGALFDIAENLFVRALIVAGPPPNAEWAAIASALTVSKYALVLPSIAVALGLLVWYLATESFGRGPSEKMNLIK